jgi:hypothetical protein
MNPMRGCRTSHLHMQLMKTFSIHLSQTKAGHNMFSRGDFASDATLPATIVIGSGSNWCWQSPYLLNRAPTHMNDGIVHIGLVTMGLWFLFRF